MKRKETFSVTEFAEYSMTTRDTLLYYDRIGLLSPESRGENNYRYYSSAQLSVVNLIRTYQALGMTLAEIQRLITDRTPEHIAEVLEQQIEHIDEKIDSWVRARKLLIALKGTIHAAMAVDEDAVTIQFRPAEAILLGEQNDYSRGKNAYDALFSFYRYCHKKYPALDLNYPVWGTFSEERIKQKDWVWPDRYYFYNPEGHDEKPAALYATGYMRGGYGHSAELYERIYDYIYEHGFEICGPAYEEYPLNEVCVRDERNYLLRVMITVRERERDAGGG